MTVLTVITTHETGPAWHARGAAQPMTDKLLSAHRPVAANSVSVK